MPYTVWSRGRLIGDTDLEFQRLVPDMRAGWFRPAPGVADLMADLTVPTPAMVAFMRRDRTETAHMDPVQLRSTTLFADMAESLQRQEELELEVRRADGALVPTANVSIQDMERLRQFAIEEPPPLECGDEVPSLMESFDADLEADIDHDLELTTTWWESGDDYLAEDLAHQPRDIADERYQVFVTLVRDDAIP